MFERVSGPNMSKPVIMTPSEWNVIYQKIKDEYPPSVYLLRNRMKNTLGFTVRDHNDYERRHTVHLDFYKESLRTMFILKYQ